MRNTFFKLWIHGIFHTSGETPIAEALEAMLYYQIEKQLVDQGCEVAAVGGRSDHVHFLFTQNPLLSANGTLEYVKAMTTKWYHDHDFHAGFRKFKWNEGYSAYSVSESLLEKTTHFINTQEEVHQRMGFYYEANRLNALHNVDLRDGGFDFVE